jgi:hypothetical protein
MLPTKQFILMSVITEKLKFYKTYEEFIYTEVTYFVIYFTTQHFTNLH